MSHPYRVISTLSPTKQRELLRIVESSIMNTTPEGCFLVNVGGRLSLNSKGYVQIAAKTPNKPYDATPSNLKVQLHQIVAWNASDPNLQQTFQQAILNGTGEVSHRCHEKRCCNYRHLCIESSQYNKSRNSCPVVININDRQVSCCKHIPKCIPNELSKASALHYNVITGPDGDIEVLEVI